MMLTFFFNLANLFSALWIPQKLIHGLVRVHEPQVKNHRSGKINLQAKWGHTFRLDTAYLDIHS